ncbi:hypothetical protein N7510_001189 [Penicillium lagena]|uniref:uncharacterized protein n=1 Tax=Penicillium lagena TaxID=94218 RepID=UPI0025424311|nr:uncharacterized protein N7510_001189 [Penicillium lagena]KAJ5624880.1 hypothetical protein N7510_001189 [Penicillium lagena]
MKRFLRLNRRESEQESPSGSDNEPSHPSDSPEGIILKEITAFCETSGAPQHSSAHLIQTAGDEFVHLPLIVETAESSPVAAKEAAHRIRRYLSEPGTTPNHVQYNAIMLMRILADNPGHTFTRNIDGKFVATIKTQLRQGRDWHVQHYLRQYLSTLETQRQWDQDLALLLQMWSKEKHKATQSWTDRRPMGGAYPPPNPQNPQQQNYNYYSRPQAPRNVLPGPEELAARVTESRNSAKLLTQFVQSTPPTEMESNDLIKEFTDRCRTASRVISGYMQATNPAPDDETLLTLIETNDELSVALSQQQRAVLKARKARGSVSQSPNNNSSRERSPQSNNNNYVVASGAIGPMSASAAPRLSNDVPSPLIDIDDAAEPAPNSGPTAPRTTSQRYEYNSDEFQVQNPFADDFATNDSDSNHPHSTTTTEPSGRVGIVPTEH